MMIDKLKGIVGLALLAPCLTACSNSSFLKSMSLSVSEVDNQSYINVSTEVSMGNIALAELTIPIHDPKSGITLGEIGLGQAADGNEKITLSLNSSSVLNGSASLGTTLPNGRALPTAVGVASGQMVGIPVLDYSRVYVGGDLKSTIIVGMALSIKAFDNMSVIGNANIFFSQAFNSSLSGVAGLFTGSLPNESGIAVFAKYTAPATTTASPAVKSLAINGNSVSGISVSGKLAKNAYNTVHNDGMSQSDQQAAYNYIYGNRQVVRPQ